jgi:AcrR family transcriptional regulator
MSSARLEHIYAAATESVAVNGFERLSIDDVASRAGCSRATVYRQVGGKEAIRDVVLNQAVARMTSSVALAVDHLDGQERVEAVIIASLATIREDPVSAALLVGPVAASSVDSAVISRFNHSVARLTGIRYDNRNACELLSRVTLALLCWPLADSRTEAAVVHQFVSSAATV